jgi:DNA-binding Xre family transcriptional regulator
MLVFEVKKLMSDKAAIEGKAVTFVSIAKEIGLKPYEVARIANNKHACPNLEIVEKLMIYFKCSVGDILKQIG